MDGEICCSPPGFRQFEAEFGRAITFYKAMLQPPRFQTV